MDNTTQTLLVVFIAVAALGLLMQAGFSFGTFLAARKTQKKLEALAEDVRLHAMPAVISSREVIQDVSPKIRTIVENLSAISVTLRARSEQIGGVVEDVTTRAHAQASRVDGIVSGTLDGLNTAVHAIEHGIAAPVRHVNGILNGLRAGVEVMRKKTPDNHPESDGDLFV
jgi:methyl-accepting chemotaxis protein